MKRLQLTLLFGLLAFGLAGQIPPNLNQWFYNLPMIEKKNEVFTELSNNNNFSLKRPSDTSDISFLGGHTFLGRILKPNLPDALNTVDSSIIELTWGILSNTGTKNSSKTYSGAFKILRIEYFISDTSLIDKIFELSIKQLAINYLTNYDIQIGTENESDFSLGKEITYLNDKKHLQKLVILKKTYLDKRKSFCLEFNIDKT